MLNSQVLTSQIDTEMSICVYQYNLISSEMDLLNFNHLLFRNELATNGINTLIRQLTNLGHLANYFFLNQKAE